MAACTLDAFLNTITETAAEPLRRDCAEIVRSLAVAAVKIRNTINLGALGEAFAAVRGTANADGDRQRDLDVFADDVFLDAVRKTPVALYVSEELDNPVILDRNGTLAIALDPLDGSSNIDTNVSIGTMFSISPVIGLIDDQPIATFLQPGNRQIAAGFFIYGPQLSLVISFGSGTHIFVFSSRLGTFVQGYESRTIERRTNEFAINSANYRHWEEPIQLYVDDCLKGTAGPREKDFNMRWIASLVAEAYRILIRGGVFLYPADARNGYSHGRLRLVYEANPIAFLIEQAGGAASDTVNRILDLQPVSLHQRTPFVFGASKEVARIARYHTEPSFIAERSPLFGQRGLFRA